MDIPQQQQQYGGVYDGGVLAEQRMQSQFNHYLAQYQLDFKEEIERIDYLLRGCVRDTETGELVQIHAPILNDRGRTHVMKKVRSWLTKITAQSNFDEPMIKSWCRVYWAELVADAYSFGKLWDLNQDEYSSFVHDLVFKLYSVMEEAKDGGLREQIGQSHKVSEVYSMQPQQKQKLM
jgi:hypothetical protein